jgi:hypothetical protein
LVTYDDVKQDTALRRHRADYMPQIQCNPYAVDSYKLSRT